MLNYETSDLAFVTYLRYVKKLQPIERKQNNNKTIFVFEINEKEGKKLEMEWYASEYFLYIKMYENTKTLLLV